MRGPNGRSLCLAVLILCLAPRVVKTEPQADEPAPSAEQPNKDTSVRHIRPNYIVPVELDNEADRFKRGNKEYYFYAVKLNYYLANQICINKYKGRLAWIRDMDLAYFLAEALSETRLEMDTLWTGGRKDKEDGAWHWTEGKRKENVSETMAKDIVSINEVEAKNRHCLGFGRADHDLPQFRALACSVERSVMCESHGRPPDATGSTHPGWIQLGKYEYKIFRNRATWNESNVQCGTYESHTKLAAVFNYEIAQQLGRYLLIGRPSLENAWLGGRWDEDSYKWMEFDQAIAGVTNATTGYPPWKGEKVTKTNGCVLLDRHVSNITLFVEARCERQRPYICYRDSENITDMVQRSDIIIGENGYRLVFTKMIWEDAYNYCTKFKKYDAQLAEIRTDPVRYEMLYVMGDNKTAVQHIWMAGRYNMSAEKSEDGWYWQSDKSIIPLGDSPLQWIKNSSFTPEVEEVNVCLNMDRENHKTALHYGTTCTEPQSFVCQFPKGKLIELQNAEQNNNVEETSTDVLEFWA